jgi:hypothetical protein
MLREQTKSGETKNVYRILVEKRPEKPRQEGPKKRRGENKFKLDCEDGSWIELANNCV